MHNFKRKGTFAYYRYADVIWASVLFVYTLTHKVTLFKLFHGEICSSEHRFANFHFR